MPKNLSIKNKLTFGLGAMVASILFLLALALHNFRSLSEADDWNRHTLEVLLEANHVATSVLQVQTSTRGFLLTSDESLVEPITAEYRKAIDHLSRAIALTADNPGQQARLKQLQPVLDKWMDDAILPQIERTRSAAKAGRLPDASGTYNAVLSGARTVASLREIIRQVETEEQRLMAIRTRNAEEVEAQMALSLWLGGAVTIVLAVLIAWGLLRALALPLQRLTSAAREIAAGNQAARAEVSSNDELGQVALEFNRMAQAIEDSQAKEQASTRELRAKVDALLGAVSRAASGDLTGGTAIRGSDAIGRLGEGLDTMFNNLRSLINNVQAAGIQVTTSATQIAAAARQQEATGVEQAQTSVEILSTTREIEANTSQLLRTMEEATTVAESTTSATAGAQDNLQRMDQTMQNMVAATDSITAKLAALSEKANNINSVLTTITKVADQTNILSLNAAIEAERAGEAGRGFAVVATEIRRLADQTSVSTWDIEQMLKEMQSAVSASVMGMDKFSEEIRRSVGEARQVALQLGSVMEQVRQLTPRFDLVLQGMQSQAVGAQQITETMMQLSDATQQTVDSLKATSEAVHELQYAAGELQSSVANFSVNA
ncbi:methyl-accepting chemotaxis protein [Massilia solisilvae]|uniref:Methyl-accepting chemotaxis protein n=1 Tax=Massilia solisilvae TaxID=1811225 RepID=A0ABT2BJQ9_9BURK|nr:methyl-accepting chemotaxis protein [Massilia solisilvae]MCS0608743.1 methyl-accepting chemotaxis protein [Massilia solisilvae]